MAIPAPLSLVVFLELTVLCRVPAQYCIQDTPLSSRQRQLATQWQSHRSFVCKNQIHCEAREESAQLCIAEEIVHLASAGPAAASPGSAALPTSPPWLLSRTSGWFFAW